MIALKGESRVSAPSWVLMREGPFFRTPHINLSLVLSHLMFPGQTPVAPNYLQNKL